MANLHELMARSPHTFSRDDVKTIINDLRELRDRFVHDGAPSGPKKLTEAQEAVKNLEVDIKL